jgi:hypothetical protein
VPFIDTIKVVRMRGSITLAVLLVWARPGAWPRSRTPATVAFFEKQVRPLLVEHCHGCHSAKANKTRGGLALDQPRGHPARGAIPDPRSCPASPEQSLLVSAVHDEGRVCRCRRRGSCGRQQIAALEKWVRDGAVYPDGSKAVAAAALDPTSPEARQFWSFQPLRRYGPRPCRMRRGRSGRSTGSCWPRWSSASSPRPHPPTAGSSSAGRRST